MQSLDSYYRSFYKKYLADLNNPYVGVKVENIVATVSIEQNIDLDYLDKVLPNVEYDPDQFPGLVLRLDSPKVTALVFRSGRMVVTGAKSTPDLIKAVKKIVKMLIKYDVPITSKPRIQIQNIVASANLGAEIMLEKVAFLLENTMYEPEQFPGLIYRLTDPHVVLLIFSSGKMVITGAKSEDEVFLSVRNVFLKLKELGCLREMKVEEEILSEELETVDFLKSKKKLTYQDFQF
ncbi:MAG: TATA-box-binding protein [Ignisphaera sp.]|nr:TATA-box-binding protein [Ignisphaera sp.]MCX8167735.1 TATA-box-binding protein [Ignisphaera sp.]MDW8085299.1 TATA-box-binding protein [Ignisphaera sp.]